MAHDLSGTKAAFLVAPEGIEQVELTEPWKAFQEAGAETHLISTDSGEVQAFNHLDKADTFPVDRVVSDVSADDYDTLVLPGGVANPDFLRADENAVSFTRSFFKADVLRDRKVTSWPSLQTDIRNAGGNWVDEEVVVDNELVTSRNPDDLPAFCDQLAEEICEGEHAGQTADSAR